MNLTECLFILNEKNYNKTLEEFREGFNEIKVEDLEIDKEGIFSEFNEIIKFKKNFLLNGPIMVSSDNDENDDNFLKNSFINNIGDENDVLGFFEFN